MGLLLRALTRASAEAKQRWRHLEGLSEAHLVSEDGRHVVLVHVHQPAQALHLQHHTRRRQAYVSQGRNSLTLESDECTSSCLPGAGVARW